jgi:hypothetical protein
MATKPWINNYGQQRNSNSPAVDDLYQSPNVFINGVPVVLYAQAGPSSSAFAVDIAAPQISKVDLNQAAITELASLQPQSLPATTVNNGGPEQGYQGTPTAEITTVPGTVDPAVSDNIVSWLAARLQEAEQGQWTRRSPPVPAAPVNPGNPNIINIWKSIGIAAYANNDQTAWCMGFVNFALKQNGYKWCPEASSWAIRNNPGKWSASKVSNADAQPGDIALWNFGHVNLVYTNKNGALTFVGGNQGGRGNNPSRSTVSIMWPSGYRGNGDGTLAGIWRPSRS